MDSRDAAEIAKGIETMISAFSAASRESFVAAADWRLTHRRIGTITPCRQGRYGSET